MKRKWLLWVLVALLAILLYRSVVFVDEAEMVIVTQFGRPVDAYRFKGVSTQSEFPWMVAEFEAGPCDQSGLHFKMPYQSVKQANRLDRRLQIYDPRPSEFLAKEKKNIDLDVFVCWRIENPRRFLETVNDSAGAESRMHDIVWSELAAEVGRSALEELVSIDPTIHRLDQLVADVTKKCDARARSVYGIEIVDVRLKRMSLPAQVRDNVFQRMRSERARVARQYRAEGEEEALKIRAEADKERTVILAKADAEATKIQGQADAEATRIYTEAHQQDPEFYELIRTLEAYEKFLDDKTTILLSSDSDLLKFLTGGSMLDKQPAKSPEEE